MLCLVQHLQLVSFLTHTQDGLKPRRTWPRRNPSPDCVTPLRHTTPATKKTCPQSPHHTHTRTHLLLGEAGCTPEAEVPPMPPPPFFSGDSGAAGQPSSSLRSSML